MLNNNKKPMTAYARYSSIGIQMLAIIGLGTFAGVKLDETYPNKNNLFTVIFSLLSVLIAIFYVVKRILDIAKEEKE
jgi:hypothetical protein